MEVEDLIQNEMSRNEVYIWSKELRVSVKSMKTVSYIELMSFRAPYTASSHCQVSDSAEWIFTFVSSHASRPKKKNSRS